MSLWSGPTKLRGANVWQAHEDEPAGTGPIGDRVEASDLQALARDGANLVVLSHPGVFRQQPPYALDDQAQENLDRLVSMAGGAGLYVVIAFRTGPGRNEQAIYAEGAQDHEIWESSAAQDAWVSMVRHAAQRYADDPAVVGLDPMVEPNNAGRLGIDEPEAAAARPWNALARRIVAAVREVDPDTPILLEPESWGAPGWLPFLEVVDDDRVVYAVHTYEPYELTHQEEPPFRPADTSSLPSVFEPVRDFAAAHRVPVAVTEFGIHRWVPGAAEFMRESLRSIDHIGAWAVWERTPASNTTWDGFDYRKGPDYDNHANTPNGIHDALVNRWRTNCVRPPA